VSVSPNNIVIADDDGAVLIPAALVEEVARVAPEQERMETWIMEEVLKGAKLPGLYPPNEDNLKRYKDWASRH
jgi:regulator of RNase E activity RraA